MSALTTCPHCQTRVLPAADGTCPACRQRLDDASRPPAAECVPRGGEWEAYQASLQRDAVLGRLQQLLETEGRFLRQQAPGVALDQLKGMSPAEHVARVVQESILPLCRQVRDALNQAEQAAGRGGEHVQELRRCLEARQRSWEALTRYALEGDAAQLEVHERLMSESNGILQSLQPPSQKTPPPRRAMSFQESLRTFTPHVWVTPALIAINVILFLATLPMGGGLLGMPLDMAIKWGANFGPKTLAGEWWRLFTCMFLHFGVIHIGFNMWVLRDLGNLLERLVGNVGFIVLYVVSGLFASVVSLAWNPRVVSAGASGAVFGACGALLGFLLLRRDTIPIQVLKPLRSSLIAFVCYNGVFGAVVPGIDMAAHIGGLVAGFFCGLLLSQPLSGESAARRWKRNLACVACAVAILPLSAGRLPTAPPDTQAILRQTAKTHDEVILAYNQLAARSKRGTLSDAGFANELESSILPRWEKARAALEPAINEPSANPAFLRQFAGCMEIREESWRQLAGALRENDAEKMKRHRELWDQAEAEVKRLFGDHDHPG